MASSEIYNAMQTGVLDAANTSSSSFVSYRIYEQVACYTPAGEYALWFMYQPLLMNKAKFESLTEDQQKALLAASEKAQAFYLEEAKKEDAASAEVFRENGVERHRIRLKDGHNVICSVLPTTNETLNQKLCDGFKCAAVLEKVFADVHASTEHSSWDARSELPEDLQDEIDGSFCTLDQLPEKIAEICTKAWSVAS